MSFPRGKQRTLLLPLPRNDSFIVADLPRPVICRRVSPLPSKILSNRGGVGRVFPLSGSLSGISSSLLRERKKKERIYSINVSAAILFARETSRSKKSIYFRIFSSRYFCRSYRNGLDSSQIRLQDPWILIGRAARGWAASFIDTVLSPDDSAIRSHIRSKGPCISRSSPRLDSPEV